VAGALYIPLLLIVPLPVFPPGIPSTDQVTAVLPVPVTVAVNACECSTCKVADLGPTVTFTLPVIIAGRAKATTVKAGTVRLVES
jgi:hypothetical protein